MRVYCDQKSMLDVIQKHSKFQAFIRRPNQPIDDGLLVLEESLYSFEQLLEQRNLFPNHMIVYVLSSHKENGRTHMDFMRLLAVCETNHIHIIKEYTTADQLLMQLSHIAFGTPHYHQRQNVCTFLGSKTQIGLSSMILLLAQEIAKTHQASVCVLHLNPYNPTNQWYDYQGKYLDEIWGSCQGGALTSEELISSMHHVQDQLYVLAGNRFLTKIYHFKEEGANHLLRIAKEAFDIVLIDTGSMLDHALSAQAIEHAGLLIPCFNQSLESREQWKRTQEQILTPLFDVSLDKCVMILNQMQDRNELDTSTQLQKELNYPLLGSLPYIDLMHVHERYKNIFEFSDRIYMENIQKIAKSLAKSCELMPKPEKKKKWF